VKQITKDDLLKMSLSQRIEYFKNKLN